MLSDSFPFFSKAYCFLSIKSRLCFLNVPSIIFLNSYRPKHTVLPIHKQTLEARIGKGHPQRLFFRMAFPCVKAALHANQWDLIDCLISVQTSRLQQFKPAVGGNAFPQSSPQRQHRRGVTLSSSIPMARKVGSRLRSAPSSPQIPIQIPA